MPTRSLVSSSFLVALALLGSGCSESVAPAMAGEPCGAERGCAEGLTCSAEVCVAVTLPPSADAGTSTDAAQTGPDAGGEAADAGGTPSDAGLPADGGSSCGPCNTPPSACHAAQGHCEQGRCAYAFVEGASCDDGDACTVDDTCTQDRCEGTPLVCNTPQAAVCISGTQLRTYDSQGTCNGGLCVYARHTIDCEGGCQNGACQTDPCATMSCNTPASVCYGAAGTCSGGSCTYPFADGVSCNDNNACTTGDQCSAGVCRGAPKACNTPPQDVCTDANTAKIHDRVGVCSAGTCSYPPHYVTCPAGCANGACNGSGWVKMQSNATTNLYGVWGTSATSVWAVGASGTVLYYDGLRWQARSSGTYEPLEAIHGSGPNNVFAQGENVLLRFDGTSWSNIGWVDGRYTDGTCISAYGADEVYIAQYGKLTRWKSGAVTNVAQGDVSECYSATPCGVWAFSPNDVLFSACSLQRWNGTAASEWAPGLVSVIYAPDANTVFAIGSTRYSPNATLCTAGACQLLNTGYDGTLQGISGTSVNRVFVVGAGTSGAVLSWDGIGWVQEAIPSVPSLRGVWAAPTGEVFAVGDDGTILKGP